MHQKFIEEYFIHVSRILDVEKEPVWSTPHPNQPSYTLPHTIRAVKVTCVNDLKNVHAAVYLDSYN